MKFRKPSILSIRLILIHATIWIIYILYELSILIVLDPSAIKWDEILGGFTLNVALFYSTVCLILPISSKKRRLPAVIFSVLLAISLYLLISSILSSCLFPRSGYYAKPLLKLLTSKVFMAQHIWRATWFIGLGIGFWFFTKSIFVEKRLRVLEKEYFEKELHSIQLQQQVTAAKLAFFKSQINPHFLFNTLNFFYSSIYPLSKPIAESLLFLSNIMRYAMNSGGNDGLVSLETEVKLIGDYIYLNQLRFDHKLKIHFDVSGNPGDKRVVSFLMMTLVENAFKHGDLTDALYPLKINIKVHADNMEMSIENKINRLSLNESNGIGMQNVEERLKLIYKDDYQLSIRKDDMLYFVYFNVKF